MAMQSNPTTSPPHLSKAEDLHNLINEDDYNEVKRLADRLAMLGQLDAELPHEGSPDIETFTCFPRLPFELRAKIIKAICSQPRLIDLWAVAIGKQDCETLQKIGSWPFTYHSSQARVEPVVVHVSKEFCAEGLQFYSLEFGTEFNQTMGPATIKITTPSKIYVNWECDIIAPMPMVEHENGYLGSFQGISYEDCHPIYKDFKRKYPKLRLLAMESKMQTFIHYTMNDHELRELIIYKVPGARCYDEDTMTID
ncbi:hypothetical protein DL98DRAFT_589058 [Cadophora sp. DSE1049]|nr:hypothetical protein DL98DRAFT_589058 [Cadophora sp. DSE1049]